MQDTSAASARYALAVLFVVALVYAGSLTGGWVWDDHGWAEGPFRWSSAIFGDRALLFRPLAGLSVGVVQALSPTPLAQRVASLGIHLACVALVGAIARASGARPMAAWCGAALFGLHPGPVEVTAWVSCRSESVPCLLTLGAWLALERGRMNTAGLLLALTPFAKEAWLVSPACVVFWMIGRRRSAWRAAGFALLGSLLYLLARQQVGFTFPADAAGVGLAPSVGGFLLRGVELFFVPTVSQTAPPFVGNAAVGWVTIVGGLAAIALANGRPAVAAVLLPTPMMAADALAAANIGVIADRYYYLGIAGIAIALSLGLERVLEGRFARYATFAWAVPVLLIWPAHSRAMDFVDDLHLFGASYALTPDSPRAAIEYAMALQVDGQFDAAEPIARAQLGREPRALRILQVSLAHLGRYDEVIALGEGSKEPEVRWNTVQALIDAGRHGEAEARLRADAEEGPPEARQYVLLGRLALERGAPAEAAVAFRRSLALDPTNAQVIDALAAMEAHPPVTPPPAP